MESCFDFFHFTLPQQSHHSGGHLPTRRSTTRTRTSTLAGTNARFVLSRAAKRPTTKKPATRVIQQRRRKKRAQPGLWVLVPAAWQNNNSAALCLELALLGTSSQHCRCTGLSTRCVWAQAELPRDQSWMCPGSVSAAGMHWQGGSRSCGVAGEAPLALGGSGHRRAVAAGPCLC